MKNPRILGLLNEIIDKNIQEDNLSKQRMREDYIKKMGGLMGYTEITGETFNIFHLKALRELIEKEIALRPSKDYSDIISGDTDGHGYFLPK